MLTSSDTTLLQTWIQPRVTGTIPQARNAQTVTPVGDKLLLFGGHSGNKHLRDLHIFDTNLLQWSQPEVRGSIPPGLRGHTANLIGNTIYLFGAWRVSTPESHVLRSPQCKLCVVCRRHLCYVYVFRPCSSRPQAATTGAAAATISSC
jgi:hypothetical protein